MWKIEEYLKQKKKKKKKKNKELQYVSLEIQKPLRNCTSKATTL
jgi:hypothetical protein